MSIINEYRYNKDEMELQVPDIDVAEFDTPPPPLGASISPDGMVQSVGQMQGSDLTQTPSLTMPDIDYSNIERATQQNIQEQTNAQAEAMTTANNVAAGQLRQNFDPTTTLPAFDDTYDFNASNAVYEGLYQQTKARINEAQLTPNISTLDAQAQEKSETSWLERGFQAINYGSNALQGALYEIPNTFNKAEGALRNASGFLAANTGGSFEQGTSSFDQFRKVMPSVGDVWGFVNGKVQDFAKPYRANNTFELPDLIPNIDFRTDRNYFTDALQNKDMSVSGTDSDKVGTAGMAPIGVAQPKLDKDNAWRNPTRYAGYVYDFATGFATGAGLQRGVAGAVGKVAGAVTKSSVAASRAAKAADIIIDPAGEALGAIVGAGAKKVKSLIRPAGSKATANVVPAASVSLVNVPPKGAASVSKGGQVTTLQGSGTVIQTDFERGTVTYKNKVGATVTANINELTEGAPDVLVGTPAKGGAALPLVTPTKRATLPLLNSEKRVTTSVRDINENAQKLVYSFSTTQPSITPYRIEALPPSLVETEIPGIVSTNESRLNFLRQKQAIGVAVDTAELENLNSFQMLTEPNSPPMFPDIPEVDIRVFSGAMSYGDLAEVIGQQVPGTQVDPGALFQSPRSTEDLMALAERVGGFQFMDDAPPMTTAELLEYLYKAAPDNIDVKNVFNEYGVPIPTQTLKEATDIRIPVQEGIPFKNPQADVVVRQAPSVRSSETLESFFTKNPDALQAALKNLPLEQRIDDVAELALHFENTKSVQDLGSLTQTIRESLERVDENLNVSANRTLETVDIGRKYDPDLKADVKQKQEFTFTDEQLTELESGKVVKFFDGERVKGTLLPSSDGSVEVVFDVDGSTYSKALQGAVPTRELIAMRKAFDAMADKYSSKFKFVSSATADTLDEFLAKANQYQKAGFRYLDPYSTKLTYKGDAPFYSKDELASRYGVLYDMSFYDDAPEPIVAFHGTRVANLENITDPIASGSRAELGTGFYLTTDSASAKRYALAEVAPNLPSAGRQYAEPRVVSYALDSEAYILDTSVDADDDLLSAFADVLDNKQLSKAKTLDDLYSYLDQNIAKYGYDEQTAIEAYRTVNYNLRDMGIQAVRKGDTINVLDMDSLRENYSQGIEAADDVLESTANRYNVDSRTAALNPNNTQAQVNFEESSVRLQAEMKGKLETDLEAAELNQRNAVTKLLSEQERIELETTRRIELTEQERGAARMERVQKEFDKLTSPDSNLDVCQP